MVFLMVLASLLAKQDKTQHAEDKVSMTGAPKETVDRWPHRIFSSRSQSSCQSEDEEQYA